MCFAEARRVAQEHKEHPPRSLSTLSRMSGFSNHHFLACFPADEMGVAEARRIAQEHPPRGMCSAWTWDTAGYSGPVAAAQHGPVAAAQHDPVAAAQHSGGSNDTVSGDSRIHAEQMAVDTPAGYGPYGSPAADASGTHAAAREPVDSAPRQVAADADGAAVQLQRRRLPRLLVGASEGRVQSCSPDGFEGAAAYVVSKI